MPAVTVKMEGADGGGFGDGLTTGAGPPHAPVLWPMPLWSQHLPLVDAQVAPTTPLLQQLDSHCENAVQVSPRATDAVQALTLSEPGAETGCAGGHCVHSTLPAVANVPSGHRMQSASEVRKWPAGHSQPQKRA